MNEAQSIFTLFFAISWGIVSNVLPKWKPFHYAMLFHKGFCQPTRRVALAFVMLNILPWILFVVVLVWLRADGLLTTDWTFKAAFSLIPRAVLPGLAPFGCYRLWLTAIRAFPTRFYAPSQEQVPEAFRSPADTDPMEPDVVWLRINSAGTGTDFCIGLIYVSFCFLALVPGPK